MKNKSLSAEENADRALESLDGIHSVEIPDGMEERMLARFDNEFSAKSKTPKWFWAAAVLLLAINFVAAINYSKKSTASTNTSTQSSSEINSFAKEFFQNGNDIYSN